MSITLNFADAEADTTEFDTVPPVTEVEYPCGVCGREAGPYGGHGRKPTRCSDHKKRQSSGPSVRATGKTAELAVQAAKTLASINGVMAMSLGAFGLFETMGAIFERNEDFEKAAYAALVTDPNLCRQIVRVGETSAKLSLGMAYLSMGMGVAPIAAQEYKRKKEARLVAMEQEQAA